MIFKELFCNVIDKKIIELDNRDLTIIYKKEIIELNRNYLYKKTADFVIEIIDVIEKLLNTNIIIKQYKIDGLFDEIIEGLFLYDFKLNELNIKKIIVSIIHDKFCCLFAFPVYKQHTDYLITFLNTINLNFKSNNYKSIYELRKEIKPKINRGLNDYFYFQTLLENSIQLSRNIVDFNIKKFNKDIDEVHLVLTFDKI